MDSRDPFAVIGIAPTLDLAAVKKYSRQFGFQFPVAIDPNWQTLHRWWLDRGDNAWTSVSFLIDRKDRGVVGRIDVQANDLLELGRELRIVGQLKAAYQMRSQAMSAPDSLYRTDADPSRLRHRHGRERPELPSQ